MISNYQRVKDFVVTNLKKMPTPLLQEQIAEEVANAERLLRTIGPDLFAQFLPDKSPVEGLSPEEWERMSREIEQHFDVKMKPGTLIQGEAQKRRDTSWWSSKEKLINRQFYWLRYKAYIEGFLGNEVVITTDIDTDRAMDNIGNPSTSHFSYKGMVVGHVQSGKTANYTALVCKAADAGYKFIVVIAGGTDNLRNQTQERLTEGFIGQNKGQQVGAGVGNSDPELLPICLTTEDRDFNKQDADTNSQGTNFENTKAPLVVVIKKHPSSLRNVIKWLRNQYKNEIGHAMLMIDDESDYASINYKDVDDPTSINKRIRELLGLFSMRSYVAYTATPYANIFIDHEAANEEYGDDLFPSDFIFALDPPTDYFSASKIFNETDGKHLVLISDFELIIPPKHKIDWILAELPESLRDAIRLFTLNLAVRQLRGQGHDHNSMLVHISRFTNLHKQVGFLIRTYLEELVGAVTAFGKIKNPELQSHHIEHLRTTFDAHHANLEESSDWSKVLVALADTINSIVVREVHQHAKLPLVYRKDIPTNAIVVGGASLSRGFTLNGLSISYFLRTTVFYDTLMQMGRWFGYRPGYEDLCRIFLTKTTSENFAHIIEATNELFSNLKRMEAANRTPNDFGLVVREHPDSLLQITARNKQKKAQTFVSSMNLNGHLKETVRLAKDKSIRDRNLIVLKETVAHLVDLSVPMRSDGAYLWTAINHDAVAKFLDDFQTYQTDSLGAKNLMPIRHIQEYAKTIDTPWDVALYSGTRDIPDWPFAEVPIKAQLRRTVTYEGLYMQFAQRKLSAGGAEEVALSAADRKELDSRLFEERGERTRFIRSRLPRPLLMLHVMDVPKFDPSLAAFGVCFPDNGLSGKQTVSYKVNTVFESGLDDLLAEEFDDE